VKKHVLSMSFPGHKRKSTTYKKEISFALEEGEKDTNSGYHRMTGRAKCLPTFKGKKGKGSVWGVRF